jgi:hypothetical protein
MPRRVRLFLFVVIPRWVVDPAVRVPVRPVVLLGHDVRTVAQNHHATPGHVLRQRGQLRLAQLRGAVEPDRLRVLRDQYRHELRTVISRIRSHTPSSGCFARGLLLEVVSDEFVTVLFGVLPEIRELSQVVVLLVSVRFTSWTLDGFELVVEDGRGATGVSDGPVEEVEHELSVAAVPGGAVVDHHGPKANDSPFDVLVVDHHQRDVHVVHVLRPDAVLRVPPGGPPGSGVFERGGRLGGDRH